MVVIGGTRGLGRTLAVGLAAAGADVVSAARSRAEVDSCAAEIASHGRRTLRLVADVRDRASLVTLRNSVVAAFGQVDILVNAAGITRKAPTLDFTEDSWRDIVDTNLTGTLRGCQIFGEHMLARGSGRIINIASLGSYLGLLEVAAYSASKSGVASLTRSLAVE